MSPNRRGEFRLFRFRFRPTLVPTLFTIPAVLIMLALGTWQVERLEWKTDLNAERTARFAAAPIDLPDQGGDAAALEFRRARVAGVFLHEREMYLGARSLNNVLGFHVITPLALADGSQVLVDRGWVPLDRKLPESRMAGQLAGRVRIQGVIRSGGRKSRFVPDNRPEENFWYFVDIPAMAAHAGLEAVAPYYIEAGEAALPGGLPIGGQTRITLRNTHLSYVIIWYALALALAVIYLVYHRVEED